MIKRNYSFFNSLKNRFLLNYSYLIRDTSSKGLPSEIAIELTNDCNLNCIMCPRSKMKRKVGYMDFKLFKKIIDQVKDFAGLVDLDLFGESLLNTNATKMINYCHNLGLRTLLNTNATTINKEQARKLLDSGLDMLTISIDGSKKETYESIRRGAVYDEVITNVHELLKLKNKKTPYINIQMIYMEDTKNDIRAFLNLWSKIKGLNRVRLKPFINLDQTKNHMVISNVKISKEKPCLMLWRKLIICWNGDIIPCCNDYDSQEILGNVNVETIREVWNNEKMQALRKKHISLKKNEIILCKDCRPFEAKLPLILGSTFIDEITTKKLLISAEKLLINKKINWVRYF